jgi:hypothetical protein
VMPFPRPLITPPVTMIYFIKISPNVLYFAHNPY